LKVRRGGLSPFSGGYGEGETPLPIPNRAVKPLSADGTWLARARESRSPPVSSASEGPAQAGPSAFRGARNRLAPRQREDPVCAVLGAPDIAPGPAVTTNPTRCTSGQSDRGRACDAGPYRRGSRGAPARALPPAPNGAWSASQLQRPTACLSSARPGGRDRTGGIIGLRQCCGRSRTAPPRSERAERVAAGGVHDSTWATRACATRRDRAASRAPTPSHRAEDRAVARHGRGRVRGARRQGEARCGDGARTYVRKVGAPPDGPLGRSQGTASPAVGTCKKTNVLGRFAQRAAASEVAPTAPRSTGRRA
jgi:hypothetical protein